MSGAVDINIQVNTFISELKRRQISGPSQVALATAKLLLRFVSGSRWKDVNDLISQLRELGKKLSDAQPAEFSSGNVIRRILAVTREELNGSNSEAKAMFNLLTARNSPINTPASEKVLNISDREFGESLERVKSHKKDIRPIIVEEIQELIDEITNIDEGIAQNGVDLIHDNEILLCASSGSKTVLNFLLRACQKRKFTVLVAENYPNDTKEAHNFAKSLAKAGIETVVIPDATVFAVMSRVGKVILGARTVFANGGCISSAGTAGVCESAKAHRTPVFVVSGLFKLTPSFPTDAEKIVEIGNSGKVLCYEESELVDKVEIINPLFDYITPDNIDIHITNIGGYAPSFMYRIVWDNYKSDDVSFDHKPQNSWNNLR